MARPQADLKCSESGPSQVTRTHALRQSTPAIIAVNVGVRPADSGVVDEYVDRRDDPERLLHGTRHRIQIADVGGNARAAELFSGSLRRLSVEVPNDDLRARCNKAFCDGESQSR